MRIKKLDSQLIMQSSCTITDKKWKLEFPCNYNNDAPSPTEQFPRHAKVIDKILTLYLLNFFFVVFWDIA